MSDLEKKENHVTPAETEYAVYIERNKETTWGNGRELSFKVGARPILPESDLDEFWTLGTETTQDKHPSTREVTRERIMALSPEEAMRIALAQYFESNEQQTVLPPSQPRPFLSRLVQKIKHLANRPSS